MARRAPNKPNKNLRCPKMTPGPYKAFEVSGKAAITDKDTVRREPGEVIKLNAACAEFFANNGYIKVTMDFSDLEPAGDKETNRVAEGAAAASSDSETTVAGDTAKSSAGVSSDGPVAGAADAAKGNDTLGRGRRKV